MTSYAPKEKLK